MGSKLWFAAVGMLVGLAVGRLQLSEPRAYESPVVILVEPAQLAEPASLADPLEPRWSL